MQNSHARVEINVENFCPFLNRLHGFVGTANVSGLVKDAGKQNVGKITGGVADFGLIAPRSLAQVVPFLSRTACTRKCDFPSCCGVAITPATLRIDQVQHAELGGGSGAQVGQVRRTYLYLLVARCTSIYLDPITNIPNLLDIQ